MANAEFWSLNEEKRAIVIESLKTAKQIVDPILTLSHQWEEMQILFELATEENDTQSLQNIVQNLEPFQAKLHSFILKNKFVDPDDFKNAFLSLQSGTGGTDACDWTYMLFRMYTKYANRQDFKVEILDYQAEEEGGIKNATLHIQGPWAYGFLKAERGVHRLVRISPFDASGRRHTSFAAVDVLPESEEEPDLEITEKDLRIDYYRSSGAGGQHVNVTDSAVRITHLPTGIVVCCQNERSQHKNRAIAMKILQARLLQKKKQEQQAAIAERYDAKGQVSWSNQIRSYFLHPYTLIKDHRTNYETGNAQPVLDGAIDGFIEAYLTMIAEANRSK